MCTFFQVWSSFLICVIYIVDLSHISGIPELLKRAYLNLEDTLFKTDTKFYSQEIYFESDELSLTPKLNKLVEDHPLVTFGSYPSWSNQYYKTKV